MIWPRLRSTCDEEPSRHANRPYLFCTQTYNIPLQNSDAADPAPSPSMYLAPEMFAKLPVFVAPSAATRTHSARSRSASRQPQTALPGETDTNRLQELSDKASADIPQIASADFLRLTDEPSGRTASVETGIQFCFCSFKCSQFSCVI